MSAICGACPDETYVWVDIFAVLQHMKDASKNSDELFPEEDLRFDTVVQQCRAVLLVCNPSAEVSIVTEESIVRQEASVDVIISLPPQRVWCCFEILHAVLNKKPIVMQAGRAHEVAAAEQVPPFAATDRRTVLNMLQLIDMGKAQAKFEVDRVRIIGQIKEMFGMNEANAIVKGAIAGALREERSNAP